MKHTIITFLLCFFVYGITHAQPVWTRVHEPDPPHHFWHNKSSYVSHQLMCDSLLLITGYVNNASCATNRLLAYNMAGDYLWEAVNLEHNGYSVGGFYEIARVEGDHIYTAGMGMEDCTAGYEPFAISKIDRFGNVVFQEVYLTYDAFFFFHPVSLDFNEETGFILASDHRWHNKVGKLMKADPEGKVEWVREYDFLTKQAGFLDDGSIVVLSPNALYLVDIAGEVTDTLALDPGPVDMYMDENEIYLLQENSLFKLDGLVLIDTIIDDSSAHLKRLGFYQDKLWVMGEGDDQLLLFAVENKLVTDTLYFENYFNNAGFMITEELVVFTGTSPSGQIAMVAFEFSPDTPQYPWPDIELVDFEISNTTYNYDQYTTPDSEIVKYIEDFDFDTFLTIRNNGAETINSLSVFSPRSGGFNCINQYYYRNFTDLSLAPGAEMTLDFGRSNEYSPPRINNEICFEILAPDRRLELAVQDNILCKTYNILDVNEPVPATNISVFPNPASDILYIRNSGHKVTRAELINIQGKVLSVNPDISARDHFDLSGIPPGIYLVRFITEGQTITLKIIK
jgi:hypothetical protein